MSRRECQVTFRADDRRIRRTAPRRRSPGPKATTGHAEDQMQGWRRSKLTGRGGLGRAPITLSLGNGMSTRIFMRNNRRPATFRHNFCKVTTSREISICTNSPYRASTQSHTQSMDSHTQSAASIKKMRWQRQLLINLRLWRASRRRNPSFSRLCPTSRRANSACDHGQSRSPTDCPDSCTSPPPTFHGRAR